MILTRDGKVFCQGENLRLYLDASINKHKPTQGFVDCTDVFPTDDLIVDCAAAAFCAMVITETGSVWIVGHAADRSSYCYG